MKIIGIYKTAEAAGKAKRLMRDRGIPDRRTSLLSPDDTDGPHLATYPHHRAASLAWMGALVGAALGGMALGAFTTVRSDSLPELLGGHLGAALIGVALIAPIGALIGAIVGWRRRVLRADFFDADARRGGTALGVVAETAEELEAARYAFRATGALKVETGSARFTSPRAEAPA